MLFTIVVDYKKAFDKVESSTRGQFMQCYADTCMSRDLTAVPYTIALICIISLDMDRCLLVASHENIIMSFIYSILHLRTGVTKKDAKIGAK